MDFIGQVARKSRHTDLAEARPEAKVDQSEIVERRGCGRQFLNAASLRCVDEIGERFRIRANWPAIIQGGRTEPFRNLGQIQPLESAADHFTLLIGEAETGGEFAASNVEE